MIDHSPRKGMAAVWTSAVSSRAPKLSCPRTFLNGRCTHQVSGELQSHALVWRRSLFEKDNNTALRQGGDERFPSNAWHPSTTFPKRLPAVPVLPDSNTKALVRTLDTSHLYPIASSSFGWVPPHWNRTHHSRKAHIYLTPPLTGSDHPNHYNHLFATYKTLVYDLHSQFSLNLHLPPFMNPFTSPLRIETPVSYTFPNT